MSLNPRDDYFAELARESGRDAPVVALSAPAKTTAVLDEPAPRCAASPRKVQISSSQAASTEKQKKRLTGLGWLSTCLLFALGCFWVAAPSAPPSELSAIVAQAEREAKTPPAPERRLITKNIEDVRAGDMVLAKDEATGEVVPKRVVETYRRVSDHLRLLTMESTRGETQELKTTNEHPFWVDEKGFVRAGDLAVGDRVTGPNGELQTVTTSTYEPHPEGVPVFNFQVEDYHTYFVAENGSRAPPVWVHNVCHYHHTIPKEIQKKLLAKTRMDPGVRGKAGLPNRRPVDAERHMYDIHDKTGISPKATGIHGGKYNKRFQDEIQKLGGYDEVTTQQILEIRDRLAIEFGL